MRSDLQELSPTRVKLTVEVPFDELKPSLDRAYREVARQVRVPGFRPGRIPPRVIDQRFGRAVVLEQAVSDAVPELYGKALAEHDVYALGQPQLEVTKLDDGQELTFTAEVDRRPNFDLPDLDGLPVTVDDASVTPDDVEQYLAGLRERFATLKGVDRPAESGDYVSIDVVAEVDGEPVEDAQASGVSYEVGSGTMLDGLDEALAGLAAGQTTTFQTELGGGSKAGRQAEVRVTVNSVKAKELPEVDDEFAQAASEFDTIGELRAATRRQLEAINSAAQARQARDRVLEALAERIDIPLPAGAVEAEAQHRHAMLNASLEQNGLTMAQYLERTGSTEQSLSQEVTADARQAVKTGFILDRVVAQEKLTIEEAEVGQYIAAQAYQMGVPPERLMRQLSEQDQLGGVVSDLLRSKALRLVAEKAAVTDVSGHRIDVAMAGSEEQEEPGEQSGDQAEAPEDGAEDPAAQDQVADDEPAPTANN